jgi:hypothetical protein
MQRSSRSSAMCHTMCTRWGGVHAHAWPGWAAHRQRPRPDLLGRGTLRSAQRRRPHSAVSGTAPCIHRRIGACVQSAVTCKGKELGTYVGRGGCSAVPARLVALLGRRRPEQWEELQWPVRAHLLDGGATTAAETARWRRVGTRVDWSCNR